MTSASGNRFCPRCVKGRTKIRRVCKYIYIISILPRNSNVSFRLFASSQNKTRSLYSVARHSKHHPDSVVSQKENRIFGILNIFLFFFLRSTFTFLRRHDKETTIERDIFFSQLQSNAPSVEVLIGYRIESSRFRVV